MPQSLTALEQGGPFPLGDWRDGEDWGDDRGGIRVAEQGVVAPVGSASVGSASVGSAPVGSASVGSAPVGSASVGSARWDLRAHPVGAHRNGADPDDGDADDGDADDRDLDALNLDGVDLDGVDLDGVDLDGVDLDGVDLDGVDLDGVDLDGVDLDGVDLDDLEQVDQKGDANGRLCDREISAEDQEPLPSRARLGARRIGAKRWGRFAELWVPESLRDARVDPGRRGALILLLVAALAAVVTAFGVWRDRPEPRAVETSAVAALTGPSSGADPAQRSVTGPAGAAAPEAAVDESAPVAAGSTMVPSEIVVSVTGLVGQPGLVTVPAGARVADAIAAAGGTSGGADLTGVNLAARLADGDSVVVGSAPMSGGAASGGTASGVTGAGSNASTSGAPASGLVNLNTADEAALDTLPGVGPVMAQNILAWRATNGRFTAIDQLQEISGIGPSRYAQLSPLVTVS